MPPPCGQDRRSDGEIDGNKGENMAEDLIWHRVDEICSVNNLLDFALVVHTTLSTATFPSPFRHDSSNYD